MFVMHESVLGQQTQPSVPYLQVSPLSLRFLCSSWKITP